MEDTTAEAVFHNPSLAEGMPYGVFAIDSDGLLFFYNERAATLWRRAPVLGRQLGPYRALRVGDQDLAPHETPMALAIREGRIVTGDEASFELLDGSTLECQLRVEPVRNGKGKLLGAVGFVSPRAEAFAPATPSHEEHLPTLISYVGSDLRYRFANPAYERWFGLSETKMLGKTVEEVLGRDAYSELAPELQLALSGTAHEVERYISYPHGAARYVRIHFVPDLAPGGVVRGTAIIINDLSEVHRTVMEEITARKKLRAAMNAAPTPLGSSTRNRRSSETA